MVATSERERLNWKTHTISLDDNALGQEGATIFLFKIRLGIIWYKLVQFVRRPFDFHAAAKADQ